MAIESVEVRVTCDECGADECLEVGEGSIRRMEYGIRHALEELDWTAKGGRHLCDRCADGDETED